MCGGPKPKSPGSRVSSILPILQEAARTAGGKGSSWSVFASFISKTRCAHCSFLKRGRRSLDARLDRAQECSLSSVEKYKHTPPNTETCDVCHGFGRRTEPAARKRTGCSAGSCVAMSCLVGNRPHTYVPVAFFRETDVKTINTTGYTPPPRPAKRWKHQRLPTSPRNKKCKNKDWPLPKWADLFVFANKRQARGG